MILQTTFFFFFGKGSFLSNFLFGRANRSILDIVMAITFSFITSSGSIARVKSRFSIGKKKYLLVAAERTILFTRSSDVSTLKFQARYRSRERSQPRDLPSIEASTAMHQVSWPGNAHFLPS